MNDFWDDNAEAWKNLIASNALPSRKVTNRAIAGALKDLNARSLLDIGCGEGFLSSLSHSRYQGIDGSQKLVEIARDKYGEKFAHVRYEEIVSGAWAPTEKFGAVVFNFSLLEEEISPLLRASASFLEAGGHLVIQTIHPLFSGKAYVDGWHEEDFAAFPEKFSASMPWYSRTLGGWSEAFHTAGLTISQIFEPRGAEEPLSIIFVLQRT